VDDEDEEEDDVDYEGDGTAPTSVVVKALTDSGRIH